MIINSKVTRTEPEKLKELAELLCDITSFRSETSCVVSSILLSSLERAVEQLLQQWVLNMEKGGSE